MQDPRLITKDIFLCSPAMLTALVYCPFQYARGFRSLAHDMQAWGVLTGETDGDVTKESICMRATTLLRLANIISSPSYLWSGRALADNAMIA